MEHNVFLLSLQIFVRLGSFGMEQNVYFMRINVLNSQNGMAPSAFQILQIVQLVFMGMEIVVYLSLNFVLLQQLGLEINVLLVLIVLILPTIEMVIVILMFLVRMDKNGIKILLIVFVLRAHSGMGIDALVVLVAKDGFLLQVVNALLDFLKLVQDAKELIKLNALLFRIPFGMEDNAYVMMDMMQLDFNVFVREFK